MLTTYRRLLNLGLVALATATGLASLQAQSCEAYFPSEAGTVIELTSYDRKEKKETGQTIYEIQDVSEADGATQIDYRTTQLGADGEELFQADSKATCTGSDITMEVEAFLNPASLASFASTEISITGDPMVLPYPMSPGQELPDASFTVSSSVMPIKMTSDVYNRRVVGTEALTTPAGTFDCVVVEYDSDVKMGLTISASVKQWYAEDVFLVRQETYNKRGKLTGVMVLTRFEP